MTRRSGQHGSVHKRGNFYYGRYYEDVPGQEKRRRPAVRLGLIIELTKPMAKNMLKDYIHQAGVNTPQHLEHSRLFKDEASWWVVNKLALAKPASQVVVVIHLNKYLLPAFGEHPLGSIREREVQTFITTLSRTTYSTPGGVIRTLSPNSVRNIIGVLRSIIGIKVWRDFNLTFPKLQPHEQRFYTPEEMRQIIDAAKGQWRVLFATLAGTGCRFGEAAGLHIEDLDFTNNTVTIKRGVYRRKEQTPKSRNAYRTVNVDEGLMKMLV